VALFVQRNFVNQFKANENFKSGNYRKALEETFLKMDEMMIQGRGKVKSATQDTMDNEEAGCTANVVLITRDKVYCANSGDSRAVLCEGGNAVALSFDHKPDNEEEKKRIEAAEGFVSFSRTNGVLSLSRALGDFDYKMNDRIGPEKQIITAFPDIREEPLTDKTEFIITACDGIWDCLSNEEAVKRIREQISQGKAIKDINEKMLDDICAPSTEGGTMVGCDNMTSIIIRFKK
jgi:protein phosphatase PTC2/3